jgi:hypothetical protein
MLELEISVATLMQIYSTTTLEMIAHVHVATLTRMLNIIFFNCQFYQQQRVHFFNATRRYHLLNINTLLFGSQRYSTEENRSIFNEVQHYIKQTSRFNN